MITIAEAKSLAKQLAGREPLSHSHALEAVARAAGHKDWNTFVALAGRKAGARPDAVARQQVVPVLRMFDVDLAKAFYVDFLGFVWVWQHQFEPGFPVYAELQRDGSVLHLSEHHGDATPGARVQIVVNELAAFHDALLAAEHKHARPGLEQQPWGTTMTVADPFGNHLVFWQRTAR